MKAYKVFNSDWTCRGFQFEVGKEYFQIGEIKLCENGFHACHKAIDCFNYYEFNPKNKVAEVELFGTLHGEDGKKTCASNIRLLREITWEELLTLVNTGDWNTGYCNTGNRNTGNWNTGNWNTGNWNTGNRNTGNWNTGNRNTGDWNTGYCNTGNRNTGNCNTGDWNTGYCNTGDYNTGNRNTGYCNTGNWNTGNRNTGYCNTIVARTRIFNKETDVEVINFPDFFYFDVTQWVGHDTATAEEKEKYKVEIETCGGFLKELDYKEAFKRSYRNTTREDREKVKDLPNFDANVFFEISGIDLR